MEKLTKLNANSPKEKKEQPNSVRKVLNIYYLLYASCLILLNMAI